MCTTSCAQHQRQQKQEGEDREGDGWLIAEQGGPEADDGGAEGDVEEEMLSGLLALQTI